MHATFGLFTCISEVMKSGGGGCVCRKYAMKRESKVGGAIWYGNIKSSDEKGVQGNVQ